MNLLAKLLITLINFFITIISKMITVIEEHHKLSIYQNIIRKASYAGSPFLKYFFGHRINTALMLMLQLISLFTTLAGAKYYLLGINSIAPFLFAGTIQLGLFYYANSFSNVEGKKATHFVLLTLLTIISIIFSYTGMAIASIPPENEYKASYNDYCEESDTVTKELLKLNSSETEIEQQVIDFLQNAQSSINVSKNQIAALKQAIKINKNIINSAQGSTVSRYYDSLTGSYITTSSMGQDGINASKKISTMTKKKTEIKNAKSDLNKVIAALTLNDLLNYVKNTIDDSKLTTISTKISNLITSYNSLNQILGTKNYISSNYIEELRQKYNESQSISSLSLPKLAISEPVGSKTSVINTWGKRITELLTSESSVISATESLEKMRTAVDDNYSQVKSYASMLNLSDNKLSSLKSAKDKMHNYGDPNVQVILYIFDKTNQSKVIGILLLAILVDGLTFFIGIFGNRKRISLLAPGTNKELIDNEEELFSIIFVSLVGMKMPEHLKNIDENNFKSQCYAYVDGIKLIIQDFLSKFNNSPWTGQWGYGLYAKYADLIQVSGAVPIISILHQLGYLQFINQKDFELLRNKFDGKNQKSTSSAEDDEIVLNDYICILRYRVEMYLHYNTAEISTTFIDDQLLRRK